MSPTSADPQTTGWRAFSEKMPDGQQMVELALFRDGRMIWLRVRFTGGMIDRAMRNATHWRPAT